MRACLEPADAAHGSFRSVHSWQQSVVDGDPAFHAYVPAVYEQGPEDGGVWAYSEDVEDDLLGSKASRRRVHGRWVAGRCRRAARAPSCAAGITLCGLLRPGAGRR